jgi:hypothetical protein
MGSRLPAGWFVDPADKSRYRWWNGDHWSTETRDKAQVDIDAVEAEMRPLPDFDALDPDGSPKTMRNGRRRLPVVLAVLALAVVAASAGVVTFGGGGGEPGRRLTGEIRVPIAARNPGAQASGFAGDGATCGDAGRVRTGTPVTVTSAQGDELGSTELGEGRVDHNLTSTTCVFSYQVDGIGDAGVYVLRVGDERAGRATRARLDAAGWQLDARLG